MYSSCITAELHQTARIPYRVTNLTVVFGPHTFWSAEVIMARGIVFPKPPLRANFVNKAKIEPRNRDSRIRDGEISEP